MTGDQEIRLEIVKTLLECGSRVALNDPACIIEKASQLEKFVAGEPKKRGRPAKTREEANPAAEPRT